VKNLPATSYRRKPVSRNIKGLKKHWTPVFTGVTTFYEAVIFHLCDFSVPKKIDWSNEHENPVCRA
jgi:hypothetical protein